MSVTISQVQFLKIPQNFKILSNFENWYAIWPEKAFKNPQNLAPLSPSHLLPLSFILVPQSSAFRTAQPNGSSFTWFVLIIFHSAVYLDTISFVTISDTFSLPGSRSIRLISPFIQPSFNAKICINNLSSTVLLFFVTTLNNVRLSTYASMSTG